MFDVGRLCTKLAGRDAGKTCVVVDIIDERYVLIDGQTRRRKCNVMHLEPLEKVLKIKKGVTHSEVKKVLEAEGFDVRETKPKQAVTKPVKQRNSKEKPVKESKDKAGKKTNVPKKESSK